MSENQFAIRSYENGRVVIRRPRPGEIEELRRRGNTDNIIAVDRDALEAGEREAFLERTQGDRPITAGLETAGNWVTGGALSEIQRGLDPTEGVLAQERADRNTGAAFVGAALASVVPSVAATRGAGLVRNLATMTGPGATAELGLAAEQAIARSLLARGLSADGSRAAGAVLGAGAEAAVDGALMSFEQSLVNNDDLTAERLLSNVGLSGLLGLGIGGTISGGSFLVRQGRRGLANRLAAQAEDAGLLGTASTLREGQFEGVLGNTVGRFGLGRADDLAILSQREGRRRIQEGSQGLNRAIRNTAENAASYRRLISEAIDDGGMGNVSRMADESLSDDFLGAARSALSTQERLVSGLSDRFRTEAAQGIVNRMRGILRRNFSEVAGEAPSPILDARGVAMSPGRGARREALAGITTSREGIEALSRTVDALGAIRRPTDVTGQALTEVNEVMNHLDQLRRQLSNLTANPRLVGDAANSIQELRQLQQRYRAAEADMLQRFGEETAEDGVRVLEIDGRRLNRVFQEADDVRSDSSIAALNDFLEAADQLREGMARAGIDVENAIGADLSRTIREQLQDGLDTARSIKAAERALTTERGEAGFSIASGLGPSAVGAFVGGMTLGPAGVLAGAAAGAFFRPASFFALLGNLEAGVAKVLGRQQRSMGRLRTTLSGSGRAVRTVGRAGTRKVPALITRLRDPETRRREYTELVEEIRELATSPEALEARLSLLGAPELVNDMPDLHTMLTVKAVMGVQYLFSTLPPASIPGPFDHLRETSPSLSEMDVFIRRFHAVEDPLSILDRAADLTLTTEEVEAVSAVYPELYRQIQADVSNMITDLEQLPPYQARINIGNLLQIPADESLDPNFVMLMQRSSAQTREQNRAQFGASSRRSINVAGDTYSESQQVALRL